MDVWFDKMTFDIVFRNEFSSINMQNEAKHMRENQLFHYGQHK